MRPPVTCLLWVFLCLLSSPANAQSMILTPKWTAQAQFAGYYAADKLGFYKEEGLDVKIQHPLTSENAYSYLEQGIASAVVLNLSYAIVEQLGGARLVNILQTSQESSQMIISHSPTNGIASLNHQKVAVWSHLNQELLDSLAEYYHLQVEWIRNNSGINIFLSGAVDHCLVVSFNELQLLAEYGKKIDPACVMRLSEHGYDVPEDGLYVTEEFYTQHPEAANKLAKASMRGWEWVNEHREEALDMVMEEVKRHNIGTNRYHQQKMLEEILRLQTDPESGRRTYHLSRKGFEESIRILAPKEKSGVSIRYEDIVKK